MTRIIVPFLDANIVDVTVVKWRKAVGETIAAGEVAVEVSTEKAAFEIEDPASGTLLAVLAPEIPTRNSRRSIGKVTVINFVLAPVLKFSINLVTIRERELLCCAAAINELKR